MHLDIEYLNWLLDLLRSNNLLICNKKREFCKEFQIAILIISLLKNKNIIINCMEWRRINLLILRKKILVSLIGKCLI